MKNPSPSELAALQRRAAQLHAENREALESAVRRVARQNRIVGLSLALCHPDGRDEFLHAGYARLSPKMPVTETTCMRVASVSKLVLSFGALALMERGLLSLDGDIGALLGYPVQNPHAPGVPITLRMLLTHTAALTDGGSYASLGMQPGTTLRKLLSCADNWLPRRPGEAFAYSNFGAGVAGCVMERAANMPLEDIMQRYVFGPLGIRASYDPRAIVPTDDLADGYSVRGILPPRRRYDAKALAARPKEPFDPERAFLCAAGRMITDSRGMAALIRLLASGDGKGVISPASIALMRTPQDGMGGVGACGRGLNVAFLPGVFPGHHALGHQGVAYGMCAELFADPDTGCGVGVMTSGARLVKTPPLMRAGFDLLALGFSCLGH